MPNLPYKRHAAKTAARKAKGRKRYIASKKAGKKSSAKTQAPQRGLVDLGFGYPKMIKIAKTYIDTINLTSTSGIPATYRFSANGLFDPNVTSTGHQPLYFDQMAVLYNHYTVLGSRIWVTVVPSAASTPALIHSMLLNDDTVLTSADPAVIGEQPQSQTAITGFGSTDPRSFQLSYSAKKTFGKGVLANNKLTALSNAMPADQQYYDYHFRAMDGLSTASVSIKFKITYIAVWNELKDVASS